MGYNLFEGRHKLLDAFANERSGHEAIGEGEGLISDAINGDDLAFL